MNTSNNDGNNNNNNNGANEHQKKGAGRRKIPIEKIQNEARLQVTFSKRRAGVFKKASELSTLCGAETAVLTFSPGNKPHSFGHPSVKAVASRFLNTGTNDRNVQGNASADHLNEKTVAVEAQAEHERRRKKEKAEKNKAYANPSLDQLSNEQFHLTGEQHQHEMMSTAGYMYKIGYWVNNNAGETSSSANHNPQGLGFHAPAAAGYDYGIVPAFPGGSSAASFDNYGYNAQYPPTGPGFNYGNPAAIDGIGRASGSRNMNDEDDDGDDAPPPHQGTGFGANYGRSF